MVQAEGLVEMLHKRPIGKIVSSPSTRCIDTVAPLADKLGHTVEQTDALQEGADPAAAYELLRKLARGPGDAVLCTHGDIVPELLRIATRDGLVLDDTPRWPKGSTWMIDVDHKRFTGARYLPPQEG